MKESKAGEERHIEGLYFCGRYNESAKGRKGVEKEDGLAEALLNGENLEFGNIEI